MWFDILFGKKDEFHIICIQTFYLLHEMCMYNNINIYIYCILFNLYLYIGCASSSREKMDFSSEFSTHLHEIPAADSEVFYIIYDMLYILELPATQ